MTGNSGVKWRPPSSHSHSKLSTGLEVWAAVFQGHRLAHFQGVERLPQWPWRSSGPRIIAVLGASLNLALPGPLLPGDGQGGWLLREGGARIIVDNGAVYQAPAHLAFVSHQGPHGRKTGTRREQPRAGPQEKEARSCGRRAHWTVPQWDKAICAPAQDCRRDGAIPSSSSTRRLSPRLFVGTYKSGPPTKKNRRMASVRFRLAMTSVPPSRPRLSCFPTSITPCRDLLPHISPDQTVNFWVGGVQV